MLNTLPHTELKKSINTVCYKMKSNHLQGKHREQTQEQTQGQTSPSMLSVAMHCLLTRWLVLSTRGASILQLHRGSSSSRSVSPASLPSAKVEGQGLTCDLTVNIKVI